MAPESTQTTSPAEESATEAINIKAEFLNVRNGTTYIKYAGYLDAAHRLSKGNLNIKTEMLQIPTVDNGRWAIFHAVVTMTVDAVSREFHGTGDAHPGNISADMIGNLIRIAETRAKSRALADAINARGDMLDEADTAASAQPAYRQGGAHRGRSGTAQAAARLPAQAGERPPQSDLPQSDLGTPTPGRGPDPGQTTEPATTPARPGPPKVDHQTALISESQIKAIANLTNQAKVNADDFAREHFGISVQNLTQAQAGELISKVTKIINSARRPSTPRS
jgi:hypothetical protein